MEISGKAVWHCALHGTVSNCPFAYMTCEDTDTELPGPETPAGLHLHRPARDNWQGFTNEYREWNDGAEAGERPGRGD